MPVGPLLTVFGFLPGRATTVGTGNVLLFLGLGLHLIIFLTRPATSSERDTVLQNALKV